MNRAPRLERSGQASTAAANIGGRWPAAQRSSRRYQGALVRLALAPTRCSCAMHCKEQAGNNGIGPAMVSYSRRLVRRGAGGLRDSPPSPVSNSMVRLALSCLQGSTPRGRASAQQKARCRTPRGPVGANLVSTLFSKILVKRVNRKICRAGGLRARDRRRRGAASTQTLDGDEFVAGGRAGGRRHRAGDLLALDLAERGRFHVVAGLAIGGGHGGAAARAGGETAVDAVAVGIVGDDERTLFGLRRSAENGGREDDRGEQIPHP